MRKIGKRKYKISPFHKLKRKLDKLCAEVVKIRDNHTCQWCGKIVSGQDEHWAHVYSKGAAGLPMRWELLNSLVLCFHCHRKYHQGAGLRWFEKEFPARFVFLSGCERSLSTKSERLSLMQNKLIELEAKLKELKNERND